MGLHTREAPHPRGFHEALARLICFAMHPGARKLGKLDLLRSCKATIHNVAKVAFAAISNFLVSTLTSSLMSKAKTSAFSMSSMEYCRDYHKSLVLVICSDSRQSLAASSSLFAAFDNLPSL